MEFGVLHEFHLLPEASEADAFARSFEQVDAAELSGRTFMVGHLLDYHPGGRKPKRIVDEGELGRIHYIYSNRLNLGQLRADENALWSLGAHDIAVVLYLAEEEPYEFAAHGECYMREGVEDVVFAFLRFPSGLSAHLHLSWLDPHKERRFTVVGSQRMATFDDMEFERKVTVYDKGFDEAKVRKAISAYFGMVSYVDDNVGKLVEALEDSGLADTTRIVYTSDHGDNLGTRGLWGKSTMYEESVGVPMLMAGPEVPAGVVCREPVSLVDSFPTIVDCIGLAPDSADAANVRGTLAELDADFPAALAWYERAAALVNDYDQTLRELGYTVLRTGAVWPAILVHALIDVMTLAAWQGSGLALVRLATAAGALGALVAATEVAGRRLGLRTRVPTVIDLRSAPPTAGLTGT